MNESSLKLGTVGDVCNTLPDRLQFFLWAQKLQVGRGEGVNSSQYRLQKGGRKKIVRKNIRMI